MAGHVSHPEQMGRTRVQSYAAPSRRSGLPKEKEPSVFNRRAAAAGSLTPYPSNGIAASLKRTIALGCNMPVRPTSQPRREQDR